MPGPAVMLEPELRSQHRTMPSDGSKRGRGRQPRAVARGVRRGTTPVQATGQPGPPGWISGSRRPRLRNRFGSARGPARPGCERQSENCGNSRPDPAPARSRAKIQPAPTDPALRTRPVRQPVRVAPEDRPLPRVRNPTEDPTRPRLRSRRVGSPASTSDQSPRREPGQSVPRRWSSQCHRPDRPDSPLGSRRKPGQCLGSGTPPRIRPGHGSVRVALEARPAPHIRHLADNPVSAKGPVGQTARSGRARSPASASDQEPHRAPSLSTLAANQPAKPARGSGGEPPPRVVLLRQLQVHEQLRGDDARDGPYLVAEYGEQVVVVAAQQFCQQVEAA